MSINHIMDTISDDQALDVKFGDITAENISIEGATFENLTVTNDLSVAEELSTKNLTVTGSIVQTGFGSAYLTEISATNISTSNSAIIGNSLVVSNFIRTPGTTQARASLFISEPYFNSTALGINTDTQAEQFINGMLMFDDQSKTNFSFTAPGSGSLDTYLGLAGSQTYAFRTTINVFPTIPTASTLFLKSVASTGVSINVAGTESKPLPHVLGQNESYSFVTTRLNDGTYIIYG